MNLKLLFRNRIIRQILPSAFFMVTIASLGIMWRMVFIPGIIILPLIVHIILQNKIMGRILGVFFMLASLFMFVVLFHDIIIGYAILWYLFGIFLVLLGLIMSILLFCGYEKQEKLRETEQ